MLNNDLLAIDDQRVLFSLLESLILLLHRPELNIGVVLLSV
jgi:hypothetical protein